MNFLETQKRTLLNLATQYEGNGEMPNHTGEGGDRVDFASTCESGAVSGRIEDLHCDISQSIGRALEKISEGTYSLCDDCNGLIPQTRLKVVPYTSCCVLCQKKHGPNRADEQKIYWERASDTEYKSRQMNGELPEHDSSRILM